MSPDLTPEIDAALDQMERLLSRMRKQGKKPITEKMTRQLCDTAIKSLEDPQDPDADTRTQPRPVLKLDRPVPRPASLRRAAGNG